MLLEEALDLTCAHGNAALPADLPGQFRVRRLWRTDERSQRKHCDLRGQSRRQSSVPLQGLALGSSDIRLGRKVDVARADLLALQPALSVQLHQDAVTATTQFGTELLGGQSRRAAVNQVRERGAQRCLTRETDLAAKPQPVTVESRDARERIPAAVVRETAPVAQTREQAPDRHHRSFQSLTQLRERGYALDSGTPYMLWSVIRWSRTCLTIAL